MRILVAVKAVPDPSGASRAARVAADGRTVEFSLGHAWILNGYDENAVEVALVLRDACGGSVTAVTVGPDRALDAVRRALAMGANDAAHLADPAFETGDPSVVAAVLAAYAARGGPYDLVLCGRQASDDGNGQVPGILAERLGWPCVAPAKAVTLAGGDLRVTRLADDGEQTVDLPLPAVVAVSSEASTPRQPPVKAILAARRAAISRLDAASLAAGALVPRTVLRSQRIEASAGPRVEMITAPDATQAGARLAEILDAAGLVR